MKMIGVAELKSKLSEYLAQVKAGEEVVVTEHGTPVAKVTRIQSADGHLEQLIRDGVVKPGEEELSEDFLDLPRPRSSGGSVTETLIEERRTGR
ncbi:MAG: type II toxin-antitoxin system prevent-host-death family antitoxin [Solirubrobacterales bacterium]|nr:type II toxin-antitoxin system prevent-host-death family antitoxin [Solirubrobacterales bacterium]